MLYFYLINSCKKLIFGQHNKKEAIMARIARMVSPNEKTVYHIISRTALDGFPFSDIDKDKFLNIIQFFSKIYFTEIMGFCLLDNHFHILVRMLPEKYFSDHDIKKRYILFYDNDNNFSDAEIPFFRNKWSNLSEFIKDIKQTFSRSYNKRHNRRGTLWAERFKSLIVENGETLINCLAYIDLNPVRAGIVKRPENYRWSSLAYHIQTNNKDDFLSMDFGLNNFKTKDKKERIKNYRKYVYKAGAIEDLNKNQTKIIDKNILKKEHENEFNMSRIYMFKYKTRYFTDSGIIGTKEFVSKNYMRFKHIFQSKNEKKPKPIKGLDGIFSLKRLS